MLSTVYYLGKPIGKVPYDYFLELTEGRFAWKSIWPCLAAALATTTRDIALSARRPTCSTNWNTGAAKISIPRRENFAGVILSRRDRRDRRAKNGAQGWRHVPARARRDARTGRETQAFHRRRNSRRPEHPTTAPCSSTSRVLEIHSHGHYDQEKPAEGSEAEHAVEGHGAEKHSTEEHAAKPASESAGADSGDKDHSHAGAGDAHHHAAHPHDQGDGSVERHVTAILVRTNTKRMTRAMALPKIINQEADAQAVMPAEEVTRLFEGIVGNIQKVLLVFAVLIVIVAGIGMMVSIYNSMSEQARDRRDARPWRTAIDRDVDYPSGIDPALARRRASGSCWAMAWSGCWPRRSWRTPAWLSMPYSFSRSSWS